MNPAHRLPACIVRLLLLGAAAACRAPADERATPAAVTAGVAAVRAEPFTATVGAIGTVAGQSGHVASLVAPAPTRVSRVLAVVGAPVRPGTPLVEFDSTRFSADARAAEAALVNAARSESRTRRLVDAGIAPRKALDQAAADLAQASAAAATARRQRQLAVLRSPIGGVVTRVAATVGGSADPSQALVEIVDPRAVDLLFTVTPADAARIRPGMTVQVSEGQGAGGESLGVVTVADVNGALDSLTRGVVVRAPAGPLRRPLRLGETVFGTVRLDTRPAAIVVPLESLVPDGEGFKVFVMDARGVARGRPVVVGGRTRVVAEIVAGLRAGERVVTTGAYGVDDGTTIVPLAAPVARGAMPSSPAAGGLVPGAP
ncbi:MAG: efflux RND transporter periplasmic adaptor subunit [Gemmatimonadaceae bacterium]